MMQPTHSSNRILLPARGWFILLSCGLAVFLNMIPFGHLPGVPDWVALVLVFWCIHQPLRVGMGAAFLLGIAMDVVDASVMGQHAIAYVVLAFVAAGWSKRILWFRLGEQALHILPMLLGTQLLMMVVRLVGGGHFPGFAWFLGSLTGVVIWHPVTYLLLLPQYRPVDRDENRPI